MPRVNSRAKGVRGELDATKLWNEEGYPDCRRLWSIQQQGTPCPDIGSTRMNKVWFVEVKRYHKITHGQIQKWLKKLKSDHKKYCKLEQVSPSPVLMYKADRDKWFCIGLRSRVPVTWEDFTMLIRKRAISRPPR